MSQIDRNQSPILCSPLEIGWPTIQGVN